MRSASSASAKRQICSAQLPTNTNRLTAILQVFPFRYSSSRSRARSLFEVRGVSDGGFRPIGLPRLNYVQQRDLAVKPASQGSRQADCRLRVRREVDRHQNALELEHEHTPERIYMGNSPATISWAFSVFQELKHRARTLQLAAVASNGAHGRALTSCVQWVLNMFRAGMKLLSLMQRAILSGALLTLSAGVALAASGWVAPIAPRHPDVPAGVEPNPVDASSTTTCAATPAGYAALVSDAVFARRVYFDLWGGRPLLVQLQRSCRTATPQTRTSD